MLHDLVAGTQCALNSMWSRAVGLQCRVGSVTFWEQAPGLVCQHSHECGIVECNQGVSCPEFEQQVLYSDFHLYLLIIYSVGLSQSTSICIDTYISLYVDIYV